VGRLSARAGAVPAGLRHENPKHPVFGQFSAVQAGSMAIIASFRDLVVWQKSIH